LNIVAGFLVSCKDNREARFLLEVAEASTGTVVASFESLQPHVSTVHKYFLFF
jgi:hypothetical protein